MRASLPSRDIVAGALLALAIGMAIGAADERFQSLIPGRECSILECRQLELVDLLNIAPAQDHRFVVRRDIECEIHRVLRLLQCSHYGRLC